MKVFEPGPAGEFEWVCPVNSDAYEVFEGLDGRSRAKDWTPIPVQRVRSDPRNDFNPADFPWLGSVLAMRRTAVEAMRDIIEPYGETLPLAVEDDVELFIFNAIAINALDFEKSEVDYFRGSGEIKYIRRPAFNSKCIGSTPIFRLPNRGSAFYVNQSFVDRVERLRLTGLDFQLVWSDGR